MALPALMTNSGCKPDTLGETKHLTLVQHDYLRPYALNFTSGHVSKTNKLQNSAQICPNK